MSGTLLAEGTNQLELHKNAFKLSEYKQLEQNLIQLKTSQSLSTVCTVNLQEDNMSSAALLSHDFGSESEDDNFNPAPAEDSDNDAAGDSDEEVNVKPKGSGTPQRRRPSEQEADEDEDDDAEGAPANGRQSNGHGSRGSADEENRGIKVKSTGMPHAAQGDVEEEDEDEEEEEEEDEEEAISVGHYHVFVALGLAHSSPRAGHESEHVGTLAINSLMSRPRLTRKMKGTKKTTWIRRILSLPEHIRTTSLISQTVQKLMIGGIESLTGSGRGPSRWMQRNRPSY